MKTSYQERYKYLMNCFFGVKKAKTFFDLLEPKIQGLKQIPQKDFKESQGDISYYDLETGKQYFFGSEVAPWFLIEFNKALLECYVFSAETRFHRGNNFVKGMLRYINILGKNNFLLKLVSMKFPIDLEKEQGFINEKFVEIFKIQSYDSGETIGKKVLQSDFEKIENSATVLSDPKSYPKSYIVIYKLFVLVLRNFDFFSKKSINYDLLCMEYGEKLVQFFIDSLFLDDKSKNNFFDINIVPKSLIDLNIDTEFLKSLQVNRKEKCLELGSFIINSLMESLPNFFFLRDDKFFFPKDFIIVSWFDLDINNNYEIQTISESLFYDFAEQLNYLRFSQDRDFLNRILFVDDFFLEQLEFKFIKALHNSELSKFKNFIYDFDLIKMPIINLENVKLNSEINKALNFFLEKKYEMNDAMFSIFVLSSLSTFSIKTKPLLKESWIWLPFLKKNKKK